MNDSDNEFYSKAELGEIKVNWKSIPKLRELKQDYLEAKPYHDEQCFKITRWMDNFHVQGTAKPKPRKGRSSVVPKLIRKQAEWRYPALSEPFLSNDDLFNVKPTEYSDIKAAQHNQLILNHQFNNEIDKVKLINSIVKNLVDKGTAIIYVGWESEYEDVLVERPTFDLVPDQNAIELLNEINILKQASPDNYEQEVPYELKKALDFYLEDSIARTPQITGYEMVKETKTVYNRPVFEVCNLLNIVVDPSCKGDMDKAQFVIWSFEASISSLKKDGRYFNLDKVHAESTEMVGDADHDSVISEGNFNFKDKARKIFVVKEYWGFWDIENNGKTKPFVAAWAGNTLIRLEENPFPDKKLPFVDISYSYVDEFIYGEPDGELLEEHQKIMGAVTRGMLDSMGRSANAQMGIRKDMLDPVNKLKFQRGEDYEFNSSVDPRQGVVEHKYPDPPAAAQVMMQMQASEAESLTGVKGFNSGLSGDSLGATATGVRGVLDAASKRELSILRRLSNGIVKMGKKVIAMNAVFLSEQETIRITNESFITINRGELESHAGKFDLKLSISTAEEDAKRSADLGMLMQTLGNTMSADLVPKVMAKWARLNKLPDLAKEFEEFKPEPDALQQEIQRLEIEKLKAEINEISSRAQENMSSAQLDNAKAITESVKAEEIGVKTDKAALDFIEQESGVTQERNLQLQSEQARGNMRLEQFKKQLESQENQANNLDKQTELLRNYLQENINTKKSTEN